MSKHDHVSPLYATIGAWYTKTPLNLLIIPNPIKTDRHSTFDKQYGAAIDAEFSRMEIHTRAAYWLYYRYLVSKLQQDDKDNKQHYTITAAYFDFVMQEADSRKGTQSYMRLDGMAYPSVKNRGETLNYAIRPHLIKPKNFELRTVFREAFCRIDKPPFIPDFNQIEQIEATKIDQQKGLIHWDTSLNKVFHASFSPYQKYKIIH